jgi:hypothetical protein
MFVTSTSSNKGSQKILEFIIGDLTFALLDILIAFLIRKICKNGAQNLSLEMFCSGPTTATENQSMHHEYKNQSKFCDVPQLTSLIDRRRRSRLAWPRVKFIIRRFRNQNNNQCTKIKHYGT